MLLAVIILRHLTRENARTRLTIHIIAAIAQKFSFAPLYLYVSVALPPWKMIFIIFLYWCCRNKIDIRQYMKQLGAMTATTDEIDFCVLNVIKLSVSQNGADDVMIFVR